MRLVLDFGETVELDGSIVYDPVAEAAVPAVILRMPAHRAAWFGRVLSAYTRMCAAWRASSWTRPSVGRHGSGACGLGGRRRGGA